MSSAESGHTADQPHESPDGTPPRLIATAYHEAGHAIMALLLGRPVHKVTIAAGRMLAGEMLIGTRLGACQMGKGRKRSSNDALEDEVLILLAGMVAESQWTGDYCRQGAAHDLLAARRLLSQTRAHNDRQLERLEQRLLEKAEHLLADAVATQSIQAVATELIAKTTISGRAVQHMLTQAKQKFGE